MELCIWGKGWYSSEKNVWANAAKMPPDAWYKMCVLKISSHSASSCEGNWSTHWHNQTKILTGNMWSPETPEKLVYVYSNSKMAALSLMPTSSRCLLGIKKMCSCAAQALCSSVTLAVCAAWPGPVRFKPSDPWVLPNFQVVVTCTCTTLSKHISPVPIKELVTYTQDWSKIVK